MKNKLKQIKNIEDEEIEEDDDLEVESEFNEGNKKNLQTAVTEDLIDDPFFVKNDELKETADEKRLRITKNLINELKNDQK